jgi:competence protein ComEC
MPNVGVGVLWALCGGFALGVFARSLVAVPEALLPILGVIAFAALIAGRKHPAKLRLGIIVAALCLSAGAGILRMQSAILASDPALDAQLGERVTLVGMISDAPDARATQVRVPVTLASSSVKVLAIFPAHTEMYYGERVRVSGILRLPESFEAGAGRQFHYPGYLAAQGITYQLDRASLEEGGNFAGYSLVAGAYRLKDSFVLGLERALPEPHAGLASGITVGDKRAMGSDLMKEFQIVSLIHIVVLSGYNITVVIDALFRWLRGAPRYVRFGAGGFVALFFAVMTGFASASLRAALMSLIAISGKLNGRIYRADRALALVGALMIAWNPYLLVFDPGFQLSFLACAGLIVFSPLFARWYASVPMKFALRDTLISTSSAQIAVLPLLLFQSGNLSLVSLPANLLVLAVVPMSMLFSAIAALGGLVFEPIAPLIGFPAYAYLSYILGTAHVLASIPFASVTVPAFSAWLLLPVYFSLFGYGLYVLQKEKAALS